MSYALAGFCFDPWSLSTSERTQSEDPASPPLTEQLLLRNGGLVGISCSLLVSVVCGGAAALYLRRWDRCPLGGRGYCWGALSLFVVFVGSRSQRGVCVAAFCQKK
eukprot:RCo036596